MTESHEATKNETATASHDASAQGGARSPQAFDRARKPKRLGRWARRVMLGTFVGGVVAMIVVAVLPKPQAVETTKVGRGHLEVTVDEEGRTRVKDRYVLSAPLAGNLGRVSLRPGDVVEAGQAIATLMPVSPPFLDARARLQAQERVAGARDARRQADAQIERAEASLRFAEKDEARLADLARSGIESSAALDRAQLDLRARKAELASSIFAAKVAAHELAMAEAASERLTRGAPATTGAGVATEKARVLAESTRDERLDITSPVRGRVLRVMRESEGVVQPGTAILEVGDPAALEVVAEVLTRDAVKIEVGAPTRLEGWGGDPLKAHVRVVEPSAFTRLSALGVEEQRVNAVLDLDDPFERWRALGDGYRVEAKIVVYRSEDALLVPVTALFRQRDAWATFVAQDGHAKLTPVEVGPRGSLFVEVVSGLSEGDEVVVHPSDRIVDGTAIESR